MEKIHGNRAQGKLTDLGFGVPNCDIFRVPDSVEAYWIHLDSSFHFVPQKVDVQFGIARMNVSTGFILPMPFDVPSNNDLVAGICYAHRQHRLYLAPYVEASWCRESANLFCKD